ncbi:uncharacterized protein LOC111286642 [Durio zibethinus]|uniref:Uncharacterized protein LOC111286642 n=1 Tax=Durio zibethinus TaxID=66656 RepID=A0A6P5XXC5_DURZI|nr:uncharacterized protein LOC111286642 [Durio zibethinus]
MGVDAKGIGLLLWRIIRFSGSCCYRFVRKYPVVSGLLIFVFFLYICFPSVFYLLMYSSPILVCTAVSIRFYLKTKKPDVQWIKKKDSDERSSADVNRPNETLLRPQKSVRRNARKEVVEWDRKDSPERDTLFPTNPYNSLSSKINFLEENSKLIFDVKGSSNMEHGESSSQNETGGNDRAFDDLNLLLDKETSKPHSVSGDSFQGQSGKDPDGGGGGGGGGEVDIESLEEGEDEEEEEVQEDGNNKAVEWTENDQKNLMDLGFSELERNKRLESLIAKRRAKRMFKIAVEKSLMDMDSVPPTQIAPILIVKNNILGVSSNPNEEELQMPGSAPSILLPTQNPFDLPYDPLEEKPNLMGDSFHQEFMAANQKEMLFCRHESFCRGPLFSLETTQEPNDAHFNPYYGTERRLAEGPAVARFKRLPDKGGHHQHNSSGLGSDIDLVEPQDSNHNKAMNSSEGKNEKITESANDRIETEGKKKENTHDLEPGLIGSEVKMETDSIKNNDSCDSSSSEASESVLDQTSKSPEIRTDQVQKAFNLSIPPKGRTVNRLPYDSSPSPSERRRTTEFNLFYSTYRRQCHTPTCSIASDLQVEVSEVGSPPLTTDGTVSSVDGDSVTYDADVDRDIASDSEELWGGSFNLSRSEANQEKLRELDDIIEEDSVNFSSLNRKPEEPIAPISPSEQEAKQNLNSTSSLSSRIDIPENGASHPTYTNLETHEEVKKMDEEVEGCKTFNVSDTLSPESPGKTMHLMEKSVVHSPSESCFEKPEKPTEELNIIGNVKLTTQGDADTLDSKSSENGENGVQILIEPPALGEMRKPAEAINLDSSEHRHGNLETSYESKRIMESEEETQESQPSKYIEEDTHNLTEHDTGDAPNAVQSREQPSKNIEEDTQNLTEHNTEDAPNAVQSRDDLKSFPYNMVDQNVAEDNVSGVKQRFGGPIAMTLNRRLVIEQISIDSYSSPRSVLPQNILEDQIPISDVEQRTQTDMPHSVVEDIASDNLAEDQPHENLDFNMPLIAQQLVENSADHSSINCSIGTLEGSSNMIEKSTNDSTAHNMNELVLEDTHGKEDSSIKSSEVESETLMSLKDAKELSKPSSESSPGSIEHLEGGSENLIEYDTGIDPSKSEEENAKSNDPETMAREEVIPPLNFGKRSLYLLHSVVTELQQQYSILSAFELEPTNSPRKVIEEGKIVININNSEVNEKEEGKNLTTDEGESQFSIRPKDINGPEKSNEHEADVLKTEANEGGNTSIPATAREEETPICSFTKNSFRYTSDYVLPTKSAAEVNGIGDVNDSLADNLTNKEILNHVLDGEGEPHISSRQEDVIEPSKTTGATSAGSVEDTEHESKRLTEAEFNADLSTSAGESNSSLNNIKNGEEIQNLSGPEGVSDAPHSGEDNLKAIESISAVGNSTTSTLIDHKIAEEASKPTESEVKAVNTEENDSNAAAK